MATTEDVLDRHFHRGFFIYVHDYRTCLNIGLVLSQLDSVRRYLRPKLITAPRVLAKCFARASRLK